MQTHLQEVILPFWQHLLDAENGGFTGYVDYDLEKDNTAEKGVILHSRILWTFSNAYQRFERSEYLVCAKHAYAFLKKCFDFEYGGVYWSMTCDGQPLDTTKHTYCQAFAIYALTAYYAATKEAEALQKALDLFHLIEGHCRDEKGYLEAQNRAFLPIENHKLSENGVMASKTMNTLLHVLEAYTPLYELTNDPHVKEKLVEAIDTFLRYAYNPEKCRMEVFFDLHYRSILDMQSYGHDIEANWLITRAAKMVLAGEELERINEMALALSISVYERAFDGNFLFNECVNGKVDKTRVWWVQAEAVVGFINAFQLSGDEKFLLAARTIWHSIGLHFFDKRSGGEWFWALDEQNMPIAKPIVEPWKCPYHNSRMCMELFDREIVL